MTGCLIVVVEKMAAAAVASAATVPQAMSVYVAAVVVVKGMAATGLAAGLAFGGGEVNVESCCKTMIPLLETNVFDEVAF